MTLTTSTTTAALSVTHHMLIGGEFVESSGGGTIEAINPATGAVIGVFPDGTRADVNAAVAAASAAFPAWRDSAPTVRAAAVRRLADALEQRREEFAQLDSADNGSLLSEMRLDMDAAVAALRYFAGLALVLRGETVPTESGTVNYTVRVPYGVVGRIVPFNHPLMFAASKIGAPLIAGNTVVLKPSEQTSLSALRLAELANDVLPAGVLNVVTGSGLEVGDAMILHPDVRRLAFTGSADTGLAIQRRAAERQIKTVTLELGGKNPLVVFPDADVDVAVDAAVRGMNFTWQGQSCGSTSRVLVHTDVYDRFVAALTDRVAALRPGLPNDPAADTGAIVNRKQLDKVLGYVAIGLDEGARLTTGGQRVTTGELADGLFVTPAVFADVSPTSRLAQEEIFGPIVSVLRFESEEEAIAIANSTRFGLTASVFTSSLRTAHRFAERVDAGYIWVNEVSRHLPGAPYGGFKDSGIGREEDFSELVSYTQMKHVHVNFR